MGQAADGLTSEVEMFDLLNPSRSCILPNFPIPVEGAFGAPDTLAFCGGLTSINSSSLCLSFIGPTWAQTSEMREKRYFVIIKPLTQKPFEF